MAKRKTSRAADEAAAEEQNPDVGPEIAVATPLPLGALMAGCRARRECWAPGVELFVADHGGRGGARPTIMMTGSRTGARVWEPDLQADLLATDWVVIDPTADIE